MKVVAYEIEIVDANCTGCFLCERACPTGAITMTGPRKSALAVVNNDRCVACMRCIDVCDDDAMFAVERAEPLHLEGGELDADAPEVLALCRAAGLDPEQVICVCTATQAKEAAVAILHGGASTFEDLSFASGVQAGCLIYCSAPTRRLLQAALGEASMKTKIRRYPCDQTLRDVTPDVAARYPLFHIEEEKTFTRRFFDELARSTEENDG